MIGLRLKPDHSSIDISLNRWIISILDHQRFSGRLTRRRLRAGRAQRWTRFVHRYSASRLASRWR